MGNQFGDWWRSIKWETVARFFKYAVLLVAVGITLRIVFDGYSYYVARRAIDAELEAKKIPSLEYLTLLSQRDRALTLTTFETRCLERTELALFRIIDGVLAKNMEDATKAMYAARSEIVSNLAKLGSNVLLKSVIADAAKPTLSVTILDDQLKSPASLLPGVTMDQAGYRDLMQQWQKDKASYETAAVSHGELLGKVRSLLEGKKEGDLSLQAIRTLEDRLNRLKDERDKNQARMKDLDEVLTRYDSWTEALTTRGSDHLQFDEIAYQVEKGQDIPQAALKCQYLDEYYAAVTLNLIKHEAKGKEWQDLSLFEKVADIPTLYQSMLVRYFKQPPAAQTLFVTLFIGALGALTLNILRLSKVGWWATYRDPDWGEILVSPFLGALAAFGIYLVGSAGLLLTSDMRNGVTALSAAFIGLLGFVSGLLYDEAFGRVRRVGHQIFSGDQPDADGGGARPEDLSLAKVLGAANASLAASLVLKFGLGRRLATESGFTFLVPSDRAMDSINLKSWTDINNKDKDAFEQWFRHLHSPTKLLQKDVPASGSVELAMDDGTKFQVTSAGGDMKIGAVPVVISDVIWERGVVHITGGNLP